jgi:N6-L-threonylcarbamoyladenine synthase
VICLGLETSCDETAAAVVEVGATYSVDLRDRIRSNVVASQIDLHHAFGGVVPEIACRAHVELITRVIEQALREAGVTLSEVDAVATANRPGLVGALLVGLTAAKTLAWAAGVPLVDVNHLEAHVYANFLAWDVGMVRSTSAMGGGAHEPLVGTTPSAPISGLWVPPQRGDGEVEPCPFPAIALVVSGGHSTLFLMRDLAGFERLGGTTDDAAGEAFDKVATLLGLGYPGGPAIERCAACGDPTRYRLPRADLGPDSLDFSFSGVKTAVLYLLKGQNARTPAPPDISPDVRADIAASFQEAVVDALVEKTIAAAERTGCRRIYLGGGVAANRRLRTKLAAAAQSNGRTVHWPPVALCTDNGASVAGLAARRYLAGERAELDLEALPRV